MRASRLTFVGEQGYEIYMPAEFAAHVFDEIAAAGPAFGLRMGGYFAINSLRMEKGYRHWGHDIGEEDTPYEAGLGFAVKLDKPGGFIGREALLRQKKRGTPAAQAGSAAPRRDAGCPADVPQRTDPAGRRHRRVRHQRRLGPPRRRVAGHGLCRA